MVGVVDPRSFVKVIPLGGSRGAAGGFEEVLFPRLLPKTIVLVQLDPHAVEQADRDRARAAILDAQTAHRTPRTAGRKRAAGGRR